MIERELKLSVPPRFRAPSLAGLMEGLIAVPLEPLTLRATYYDTPDLRLIRWGCTFRHRSEEGWTVKLPSVGDSSMLARPELRFEGSPRHPPAEALDLLRAYVRRTPLEVVARLRTLRLTVELRDASGAKLAELVDDEVSVIDGHRVAGRFRELEIELADGAADDGDALLAAVVSRLEAEGATVAEPTPKLVRAVGPRALEAPEVDPVDVDESATGGEVVTAALARSVARFMHRDPGVVLGEDPEDVHQARVALRRLRSDLRTFSPLLEDERRDHLRSEASWLGRLLGDVRDAEVLHEALSREADTLPPGDGEALRAMIGRLQAARTRARARLLEARRSERFLDLCEEMVETARAPALTELANEPADVALPPLLARPWRRLRRSAQRLDADSPDAELHELRILAKRLRYASETMAPAAGKRARRLARGSARLQDVLGLHQDATIAQAWLREAAESATPGGAFAAGEVYERQALEADRARRRWPKAWRRLERSADRGWLKRARFADGGLPREEPSDEERPQEEPPHEPVVSVTPAAPDAATNGDAPSPPATT
ncbi:MAG: CHAD domain-containing protein [Thermoleophilaceae bacterium]